MQDVDGLKPSEYLYETARKSIDGEISVDEAGDLINSYYESKDGRLVAETRTEEADKVYVRIAKLLSEKAFIFSPTQYISIHRELFNETTEFLEKFLRNLLLGEKHELHNREMHIRGEFLLGHADPINDPIKFDERESRIIELLREDPSLTRAGMAEQLGCSDSTVKRILQNLVDKGAIKRIGSNKKGEGIIL